MVDENISLLESAIHISEERDKRSLANALVENLADHLEFSSILLLTIPRIDKPDRLEITSYVCLDESRSRIYQRPDTEVPYDDLITRAIDRCEVVSEKVDEITRTIFPIIVSGSVIGLLVVNHYSEQCPSQNLITGFLHLYSNFIAILDDNEHDTLTGLLNRKSFDSLLSDLLTKLPENRGSLKDTLERRETSTETFHWLGILDIDHFKRINDNFGHLYGDEVLMMFANIMSNSFRKQDLMFRYGGEEFVVAVMQATEENAIMVFERFREKLKAFKFPQVSSVTASIGFAKILPNTHLSVVMERADKSLYYAKNNGRNQLANYHRLVEQGEIKERNVESDIEIF